MLWATRSFRADAPGPLSTATETLDGAAHLTAPDDERAARWAERRTVEAWLRAHADGLGVTRDEEAPVYFRLSRAPKRAPMRTLAALSIPVPSLPPSQTTFTCRDSFVVHDLTARGAAAPAFSTAVHPLSAFDAIIARYGFVEDIRPPSPAYYELQVWTRRLDLSQAVRSRPATRSDP